MKRLRAEKTLCSGCRYCELVCSYAHYGKFNPKLSRIRIVKEDEIGADIPVVCRQCKTCLPAEECPIEAIERDENGALMISEGCIGCGECISACPFGSISWNPSTDEPLVCDLCKGDVMCVKKCPTGALSYGELHLSARERQFKRAYDRDKLLSELMGESR